MSPCIFSHVKQGARSKDLEDALSKIRERYGNDAVTKGRVKPLDRKEH